MINCLSSLYKTGYYHHRQGWGHN